MFNAIAAFRFIKYLYSKFLYLFGLAKNNPHFAQSVWKSEQAGVIGGGGTLSEMDIKQPVKWPIVMYMGVYNFIDFVLGHY